MDTQLDAIKTSELDKEIMMTLKASTAAMKKAGITLGVQEVESVMTELDEQMREVQDVTTALANPLQPLSAEDAELDAELDQLLELDPPLQQQEQAECPPAPAPEPARVWAEPARA